MLGLQAPPKLPGTPPDDFSWWGIARTISRTPPWVRGRAFWNRRARTCLLASTLPGIAIAIGWWLAPGMKRRLAQQPGASQAGTV
jgi:hypothetical protein